MMSFATLPRKERLVPPVKETPEDRVSPCSIEESGSRPVHDGYATIRAGISKRGRAISSPSVSHEPRGNTSYGGHSRGLEPLWEERSGVAFNPAGSEVSRRERSVPWWEVATRRSKYQSCPAFSQINIVSALEQTLSAVTNKLERLASSPDLQAYEAEELRQTAAILKQHSSAIYQSVSSGIERHQSCDSVSSVSSSLSGVSGSSSYASFAVRSTKAACPCAPPPLEGPFLSATPKLKKRNWLRSSFRRAFGRKRNRQGYPVESRASNGVLPSSYNGETPSSPLNGCLYQPTSASMTNKKSRSSIASLQQELREKERVVAGIQAELLCTQRQLQAQDEVIMKLQAENASLKEENLTLSNLVRNHGSASLPPRILKAISLPTNTPAVNPSGKQLKVYVVERLRRERNSYTDLLDDERLVLIGVVHVQAKSTWNHLDELVASVVKEFCRQIEPTEGLGLDVESIYCYQLDDVVRIAKSEDRPELLPVGYCVGDIDRIYVWFKNGYQTECPEHLRFSSAVFSSTIPFSCLQRLMSQLKETNRLVIVGPASSGKSCLAATLAEMYVSGIGREATENAVNIFKMDGTNTLHLCTFLSSIWPHGLAARNPPSSSSLQNGSSSTITTTTSFPSSNSSSVTSSCSSLNTVVSASSNDVDVVPAVIIIDDVHEASGIAESLQRCLPTSSQSTPAIIATSQNSPGLATRLQVHCNFRCSNLTAQQDPLKGLLARILRKRIANTEIQTESYLPEDYHVADWLSRLWMHLNSLLGCHSSPELTVGPGVLIDCPVGHDQSKTWFIEVWNSRIVPRVKNFLSTSSCSGLLSSWTDPKDWVLLTHPWLSMSREEAESLCKLDTPHTCTQVNRLITPRITIHRNLQKSSEYIHTIPNSRFTTFCSAGNTFKPAHKFGKSKEEDMDVDPLDQEGKKPASIALSE